MPTSQAAPNITALNAVTALSNPNGLLIHLVAYNAGGSTQSNASSVTTIKSSPDGVPFPNITIINETALAIVWSTPLVPNGIVPWSPFSALMVTLLCTHRHPSLHLWSPFSGPPFSALMVTSLHSWSPFSALMVTLLSTHGHLLCTHGHPSQHSWSPSLHSWSPFSTLMVLQTNIPSGFSYMSTDLPPFTAYSCSILACTVRGYGSSTPILAITAETPQWATSPDGFDAVSVQNVGSTYIIVSWDLPTHSNGILINFSLYCNGALAGVLPLTVISYNTTGLLPFTLYIYMSSSHARRHCTPVGTWCWASSVLQPACPVHCDSNLLSMRRTALLGDPLILSRTLMTLSSAYLL
ncbi:hypothetical protein EMCRGX_G018430 [Ephydatia muelleri]